MASELVPKDQALQILELIRNVIYYHDLGKINPKFQEKKMRNKLDIEADSMNTYHSFYGNMLFDHAFFKNFKSKNQIFYLLSQTISRHHTRLRDIDFLHIDIINKEDKYENESEDLKKISKRIFHNYEDKHSIYDFRYAYNFKTGDKESDIRETFDKPEEQEAMFYLYKLTYSLLILSDYYATGDYMQSVSYLDKMSTIDSDLIARCKDNFYKTRDYNARLQDESFCKEIRSCVPEESFDKLRTKILLEADDNLRKDILEHPEHRVFYLKVPTGGGKTNISIKLALTLLELKKDIKRVFYVFPFINIIEQNYEVIKDTLGLNNEIAPVYSTSSWDNKSEDENELLQYALDNEFLNYPFVVMSNVNFFNSFVKSGKAANYRLVNLSNSIIIIDEIQSINDKQWTLFNDLIMYASKYLNIHFIIMSATLPRLDSLSDSNVKLDVRDLIEDPNVYFQHKKFSKRTQMIYRDDINDLDSMYGLLKQECKGLTKILVVVNKVKQSLELYRKIKEDRELSKDFDVFLLNSAILPHMRQIIIKEMKTDKKVILVSTQSVEAGVDIDCDLGIRDMAIFDSLEQVAGRVNRNSADNGIPSKLFITSLKNGDKLDAASIYGGSHRWQTIREKFQSQRDIQDFLDKKDFDGYYDKVLCHIESVNNSKIQASSKDMIDRGIRGMDFEELNKANIIEQNSFSFMIDIDLDKDLFTQAELDFLNVSTSKVSGREIWQKYHEFSSNFASGHAKIKINTKIWSSIISKFKTSVPNDKLKKELEDNGAGKIPLLKKEFYSEKEGLQSELSPKCFETDT